MRRIILVYVSQYLLTVYGKPSMEDIQRVFYMDVKPLVHGEPKLPEHCMYNLCNETKDLKEEYIANVVSKHRDYLPLFGSVLDRPMDIGNRYPGQEPEKMNMCKTKPVTLFPKKGLTIDSQLKTIVNVKGYQQMVTFEACEDGTECYASKEYLPLGVRSFCETQYIIIRLVVINDDDTLGLERFSIPAGCSCMYTEGTNS